MPDGWRRSLQSDRRLIEQAMRTELRRCRGVPRRLRDAMNHSLFGGGKRLRPLLALWTFDALALSGPRAIGRDEVLRVGAAIEMIHTYSLVHDDLPAMDDDVLRRGRATCHVAYDEGTAILAGDGLQSLAFGVLASVGSRASELVALAAAAAGPVGMVGGQQRDLDAEGTSVSIADVTRIHAGKTAAMIAMSFAVGAVCRDVGDRTRDRLETAGRWLGLAFQGADDILDVTATSRELGKTAGKDAANGKATWVRLEGLQKAAARTMRYGRRGVGRLGDALPSGPEADRLLELASYMWQRGH